VPADLQSIADPRTILLVWAAGLALVAAAMSYARIVGVGFTWLTAGVAGLVGIPHGLTGGAWWARLLLHGVVVLIVQSAVWPRFSALWATPRLSGNPPPSSCCTVSVHRHSVIVVLMWGDRPRPLPIFQPRPCGR
jgi:hypothetical protein